MKSVIMTALATVFASTVSAGNLVEPAMEPEVVEAATTTSGGGLLIPIMLLILLAAAASGGSDTPPPVEDVAR